MKLAALRNTLVTFYAASGSINQESVMPRNILLDSSEMASEISLKHAGGSMEMGGSMENHSSQAKCRNPALVSV